MNRKRVALFSTVTADPQAVSNKLGAQGWSELGAHLPRTWTTEQVYDFKRAALMACYLMSGLSTQGPERTCAALAAIERGCAEVLQGLQDLPSAVWHLMDGELVETPPSTKGRAACKSPSHLAKVLAEQVAEQTPPLLQALAHNAKTVRESIKTGKDVKPVMQARRFIVGRLAEAYEDIGGMLLPASVPADFLAVLQLLAPAAGVGKIGRTIVREVLQARAADR